MPGTVSGAGEAVVWKTGGWGLSEEPTGSASSGGRGFVPLKTHHHQSEPDAGTSDPALLLHGLLCLVPRTPHTARP